MTDEIDDDEPYGTYAPRRPKRVLHSQVVEFKMTDTPKTLEEEFAELIIKHGPRSPVIHAFMHEHRNEGLFLRYALRLTQLQEYATDPELLRNRRNHMNDTEQDLRDQLDERIEKWGTA